MSDIDPILVYIDYSITEGKLVIDRKKNPISYLSRIKNPNLLYLFIAAAL